MKCPIMMKEAAKAGLIKKIVDKAKTITKAKVRIPASNYINNVGKKPVKTIDDLRKLRK